MTAGDASAIAPALRAHPAIERLLAEPGFAELTAATHDAFAQRSGHALLAFLEDPARYKETLDLAVIVPEIARAFGGRFGVGVLLPEAARAVAPRYGFRRWPALVLLKDGRYVGAVAGLRAWDEYLTEIGGLLAAAPSRPPALGIPVRAKDEV